MAYPISILRPTINSIGPTVTSGPMAPVIPFSVGQVLRVEATGYVLAQADTVAHATGVVGIVKRVVNPSTVELARPGDLLVGMAKGVGNHFLSDAIAGDLILGPPRNPKVALQIGIGLVGGDLLVSNLVGTQQSDITWQ